MLYKEFIKAGITLEEIELMEIYAELVGLELGEHNRELCFIDSEKEEIVFIGLNEMIEIMKIIHIESIKLFKNETEVIDLLTYASGLISVIEDKAKLINGDVA